MDENRAVKIRLITHNAPAHKCKTDAALKIYEPLALDGSFNARRYTNFIIRGALCPAVRIYVCCLSEFAF